MPAYHVERSVKITAPSAKVRDVLEDFSEWPKWSPWLCMEPETKLNFFGEPKTVEHGYEWEGKVVGAGKMRLAAKDHQHLTMDLEFLRPFKSRAGIRFDIDQRGDETGVTWHMDGKLPFFMFFMTNAMKTYIGMDYERGLKMLKEYVETGAVKSQSNFAGIVDVSAMNFVGVEDHCSMDKLGDSMKRTLPAAHKLATDQKLTISGSPGTVYNKMDLKNQNFHYTAIMPISESVTGSKHGGAIEPCKALKVIHTGSYEHVGNAWSTVMAHQRTQKLKPHKSQAPFEFYLNDPAETAEEELVTEIYVPIRT